MKTKKILCLVLSVLTVLAAFCAVPASAEETATLLEIVNFADPNLEFYKDVAGGEAIIAADGSSITVTHPDAAGNGFFGPKLTAYPFIGQVYTLEFWCEVDDPAAARIGARLVRATDGATYGFFTNKDEFMASAKGLRNGTAQATLDGDLWRYHEGAKNRQFFRVIVDGVNGKLTFYSKDSEGAHNLAYMGEYAGLPVAPNPEQADYLTACLWLWDVGTVSMGDFYIYSGAMIPEEPAETEAPETQAPETQAPETQAPETQAPETQAPETQAPETQAPETQAPETQAPETQKAEEKSGCGSSVSAGIVAVVALIGAAYVTRKHD